jgi:glycosyltransferase involved in cell wall biosynthesis
MKIYHLVDEITDKNQSIVSIIKQISKYKVWKFFKVVSQKRSDTNNKNLTKVLYLNNFIKDYLIYFSSLRKIIKNKPETIVHVHGLWRPIYFFSLLFCKLNKVPFLIQPHGMLLDDALKSNTYINYLFKIITLKIYNIFLKNVFFLAVTKQETDSIKKYFKKPNIKIIENPFQYNRKRKLPINKKFIYFGRINEIKNIDLIIKAFIESKPSSEWTLELYGIQDDKKYFNYLEDIIEKSSYSKQIFFKKPIFGEEKYKIISSAWCNVLISKSEILSLSVLESFSVGTPSMVNKNIYFPNWIKKTIFLSENKILNLKQSFNSIMKLKISERKSIGDRIIKNFDQNYSNVSIKKRYIDYIKLIVRNISFKNNVIAKPQIVNISQVTLANSLNLFLLPFIVILFTFMGRSEISADISIISGSILILCQVFSANGRVILISNFNEKVFREFMSFRIILSLFFIISFYITSYYFPFFMNYNNDLIVIIILLSWLNELNLIYLEIKKMFKSLSIYIFVMSLIYSSVFYSIIIDNPNLTREILKYNALFYILFLFYYYNFKEKKLKKINIFHLLQNFKKLALLSSISNIIAVLIWRYSIYFTYDKKLAGIMIAAFSVASFPGTLVNNIVGPSFVKLKLKKFFLKSIKNILYIALISLMILFLTNINQSNLFYKLVNISLIGTIVLTFSIYLKNLIMINNNLHNKVFKIDILYSISIFPLIIILNKIGGYSLASYAYLVSGVISFIFYSTLYKKYESSI